VYVVDALGEGGPLARRLSRRGNDVTLVPESGLAVAVARSTIVLLEAAASGPPRMPHGPATFLATAGSHAAAAVGRSAAVPVWLVAGLGRVLPGALWEALLGLVDDDPLTAPHELVPWQSVDQVVGPEGPSSVDDLDRADCPVVSELLRR
jgi:hypothetical protein